jgi:DNA-binding NarL/FixJ family response regulator
VTPVKTLLVEDHAETRHWFEQRLAPCARVRLIASVGTLKEALARLREAELVLLDLHLPDGHGLKLIERAGHLPQPPEIMVVSVFGDERSVLDALSAGARSYLLKDSDGDSLIRAVEQLLDGGAPITPSLAVHVLKRLRATEPGLPATEALTDREVDVLKAISRGGSYKAVAEQLALKPSTVASYVKAIYRKLEAHCRLEAIQRAVRLGLIDPD